MGTRGIQLFARELRYRNKTVTFPGGSETSILLGQEKGIDVCISLDIIRYALENVYDVALVFSQDDDLSEAAIEVRKIIQNQNRWIKIASVFPVSPTSKNKRGINKTDWIRIERAIYDACIDPNDYRPKQGPIPKS